MLVEAAQAVNSCPIARSKPFEDPSSGGPITLLHLQLGRASIKIPDVKFDLSSSLTKRLRYLEEMKAEFWKRWMAQVFQGQVEEASQGRSGGRCGASEERDCSRGGVPAG